MLGYFDMEYKVFNMCNMWSFCMCTYTPQFTQSPSKGQVPKYKFWLQDMKITDHSILVWINQFYCTVFLLRFHSRSNCISMVQSFRSCPVTIKSNKEIEVAQKTKPLAIKWQKIKLFYKAWMTDLPWHKHQDDTDTGKSGISVWPLLCWPCWDRMETVPQWWTEV